MTDQVVDDRVKQIDRHEHVAVNGVLVDLLLHQQRSYADQAPVVAHQRRAAPLGMSRRGEQGFVEHILPVARELPLVDDPRLERVRVAAVANDDYVVFGLDQSGRSLHERLDAETAERLHQAEAAGEVVCQRIALHHGAVVGGKPDGFGFGDQIADGKDEAVVANDDAVSGPLGTQDRRSECIFRNIGAKRNNRIERGGEVEVDLPRARLQLAWKRPFFFCSH